MNVIKLAIISKHFREYRSLIRTLGRTPVHWFYHAAFAPKRWNGTKMVLGLHYGDCRFLPNANCGEKNLGRGQNGRVGRVSGNKTFFFFFFFSFCLRRDVLTHYDCVGWFFFLFLFAIICIISSIHCDHLALKRCGASFLFLFGILPVFEPNSIFH